jgi:hypothetical protein
LPENRRARMGQNRRRGPSPGESSSLPMGPLSGRIGAAGVFPVAMGPPGPEVLRACGPIVPSGRGACQSPGTSCRWGRGPVSSRGPGAEWAGGFAKLVARCPVGPEVPGPAGLLVPRGRGPVGTLVRGAADAAGPGGRVPLGTGGPWGRAAGGARGLLFSRAVGPVIAWADLAKGPRACRPFWPVGLWGRGPGSPSGRGLIWPGGLLAVVSICRYGDYADDRRGEREGGSGENFPVSRPVRGVGRCGPPGVAGGRGSPRERRAGAVRW